MVVPSWAVTVKVTGPLEKSTEDPEAGETVAPSDTMMVGTRAESGVSVALALTVNVMVSPSMTGWEVTMLFASMEVSKVKDVI